MGDGSAPARCHVVVHGFVQGVWFHESCRRVAEAHGVAGWVRNRADGTVEAVLEGSPDAVARVVSWCRDGPCRAQVTGIDVTEQHADADAPLLGFRVR